MNPSSRPPLDASRALALVVTVRWGESVLRVERVSPPRSYSLGEAADLWLPAESLGDATVELVRIEGRRVHLAWGDSRASELTPGEEREVTFGAFTVSVALEQGGARAPRGSAGGGRRLAFHLLSASLHAAAITCAALLAPPPASASTGGIAETRALLERHAGTADAPDAWRAMPEPPASDEGTEASHEAWGGAFEQLSETAPERAAPPSPARVRLPPRFFPKRPPSPRDSLADASSFGLAELLESVHVGPPSRAWAERPTASDVAMRHLWEDVPGSVQGLELTGVGSGGGKHVDLVVGEGGLRASGALLGQVQKSVRKPVFQGVVGQTCFDRAVSRSASLAGVVKARLTVGADGAVTAASDAGSDLPDAAVVGCVVRAYVGLQLQDAGPATLTRAQRFGR